MQKSWGDKVTESESIPCYHGRAVHARYVSLQSFTMLCSLMSCFSMKPWNQLLPLKTKMPFKLWISLASDQLPNLYRDSMCLVYPDFSFYSSYQKCSSLFRSTVCDILPICMKFNKIYTKVDCLDASKWQTTLKSRI